MATDWKVGRIAIVGVGLIGGSLARALKAADAVAEVVGISRNELNLQRAHELGVIDRFATDIETGVDGADIVVIATPVGTMRELCARIGPVLGSDSVVTDVGSVKRAPAEAARAALGDNFARFVPGHPVAGTEKSGVEASFAELYRQRTVILTPESETDPAAVRLITDMWYVTGARVTTMSIGEHDRILATTSHLPHMLAFALVDFVAGSKDADAHFELAAGGFYDFTRIASSDPVMWRDISLANADELGAKLRQFADHLQQVTRAVEGGDGEWLQRAFGNARRARSDALAQREHCDSEK